MPILKPIILTAGILLVNITLTVAALVDCPDCGNAVSSRAPACPKCGCPTTQQLQAPDPTLTAIPQTGAASFQHARNALIIVETLKGAGSGFVTLFDGVMYVLTNVHVLDDCTQLKLKTLDGQELRYSVIEFSNTKDLARIQLLNPPPTLTPLTIAPVTITINQPVVVYGNSLGTGVATELKGKLLGIGPEKIEIDADFVGGNSGSPILDAQGQVIGVATYVTRFTPGSDWVIDNTRFAKTRRFGLRLDKTTWVKVIPNDLRDQLKNLSDVDNFLIEILTLIPNWISLGNSNDRSVANKYLETYSAKERKNAYVSTGWAEALERFCDVYIAIANNDMDKSRAHLMNIINNKKDNTKTNPRSFQYQTIKRERDAILPTLAKRARGIITNTKWNTAYLTEEADVRKELLDFLDDCINKCMTGETWGKVQGSFGSRRNVDGVLK